MHTLLIAVDYLLAEQLRALYLGDNDFETLPPAIGELRNLQVVIALLAEVFIFL